MKRAAIDWGLVRSRLQSSERALEEALTESPERIDAAYHLRAARLAKGVRQEPGAPGFPVMVFRLGLDRYAIETKEVVEALRLERCTPVPGSPPLFAGVITLRGELRAVLDLEHLLAPSNSRNDETGFVLMLRRSGKEIGLKVDHIEELREIRQEDLAPPPQGSYGKGLVGGSLTLLSVDAVLAAVFSKEESRTA